jgi:glutamate-5-semialdehyde dehydrogenase
MKDVQTLVAEMAVSAKKAAGILASSSGDMKNEALLRLAQLLIENEDFIKQANTKDLKAAQASGMESARLDRLRLDQQRIQAMADACQEVAAMPDPVGGMEEMEKRPNGLLVGRMRIPLGVIAIIYESRPNVTIDAGILCLKAGNALILRGGSEAFHSNTVLTDLFSRAIAESGLPGESVQLIPTTDREAVRAMLQLEEFIDVVIPRGGEGLIRTVVQEARMPVLKHYKGICHVYVDKTADLDQSLDIIYNAKVQRPGVCNALECLLVHQDVADRLLARIGERLGAAGVRFKADEQAMAFLKDWAERVQPEDYGYEFLDLIMAVKVVSSREEAQEHIAKYGSNHTEAIVTRDYEQALAFLYEVDASLVLVNASTRFNDGGQLGLGAEIGISTSKLHAYGPMGLKELTSTKFIAFGNGQIRTS